MAAVIKLDQVTKTYGKQRGVSNVSLDVDQGSVFGFLGPNGAGKTTTISMLVDLIRPTTGKVSIFGLDCQKDGVEIRQRIGFLAGDFALDERLTGWQQLKYFANLRGDLDKKRIKSLAERLSSDLSRPIKTLSRGNRQKIGLISALMHDPELLIFDEPTSGLDPIVQAEFNKIILEYKSQGKTTFISSHLLSEVQEICDQVAFIKEGELIATKTMQTLAASSPKQVRILGHESTLLKSLRALPGLVINSTEKGAINCSYQGDINELLATLTKLKVEDVTIQDADLETIFMTYYQEKDSV